MILIIIIKKEEYGCTGIEDNTQFFYVVAQLIEYGLAYHRNEVCANLTSSPTDPSSLLTSYSSVISSLLSLRFFFIILLFKKLSILKSNNKINSNKIINNNK